MARRKRKVVVEEMEESGGSGGFSFLKSFLFWVIFILLVIGFMMNA